MTKTSFSKHIDIPIDKGSHVFICYFIILAYKYMSIGQNKFKMKKSHVFVRHVVS